MVFRMNACGFRVAVRGAMLRTIRQFRERIAPKQAKDAVCVLASEKQEM